MEDTPPTTATTSVDKGNAKMDGTEIVKKSSKSEQKEASSEDDNGESKDEEFGDYQLLAGDDSSGVLEMFIKVACKWKLPAGTKIHPIFHASCLKQQWGRSVTPSSNLPIITDDGLVQEAPMAGYQEECTGRKLLLKFKFWGGGLELEWLTGRTMMISTLVSTIPL